MKEFERRYKALNSSQKKAVDTIDGPVMVIAGPGTGKTELLSMRVANILRLTDMSPSNILCLTFTESGALNMQERLVGLIGQEAYHVNIQTFHGFGSEIINTHPDYFYSNAEFHAADELSTHQILQTIFKKIPHDNPLGSRLNGTFTQLRNVQNSIADFKKSGLTPDEIQRLVRHNQGFVEFAEPRLKSFFNDTIGKKMLVSVEKLLKDLEQYESEPTGIATIKPLSEILVGQLRLAANEALGLQKTTPITAWRNKWLEKNTKDEFVLKDTKRSEKLLGASYIYQDYLNEMQKALLYDYDDMILRLVHALEVFPDLRFSLQEKYQYILVDEFQDTNGAQMRILESLLESPTSNEPNIMVVGDDDQAIYRFQGAEISNILEFQKKWDNPSIITLNQNYRSTPEILSSSRQVITLGQQRLENLANISKQLVTEKSSGKEVSLIEFTTSSKEYGFVAKKISEIIKKGTSASDIAVLARKRSDIESLLPYLDYFAIDVSYEHDEGILDNESVLGIIELSRLVCLIAQGNVREVDTHLSEVLAHPAWEISALELWDISLQSYKNSRPWLETILQMNDTRLQKIAHWLLAMAKASAHTPLEQMLDLLLGTKTMSTNDMRSPMKEFYFSNESLLTNPELYTHHLNALSSLRTHLREYKPSSNLKLADLVGYVKMSEEAEIHLKNHYLAETGTGAISVMTAHRAKGLEFDTVFIIGGSDQTWGLKARSRQNRLSYPANLLIAPTGSEYDDQLRLFFVAMTRAKKSLYITYGKESDTGQKLLAASFLVNDHWKIQEAKQEKDSAQLLEAAKQNWHNTAAQTNSRELSSVLRPLLKNYKLSATHLNNFIDVTSGGPQGFLFKNLLHFPESLSPSAAMGSSVHTALQRAHIQLSSTGEKKPIEDILYDFEKSLASKRLDELEFNHQLQKGSDALSEFLHQHYEAFTKEQIAEFDFASQGVMVGEARLTGKLDVIAADPKQHTLQIIDYKTGKPSKSWAGKTDYEKIKLHKYKQQLMFYELLCKNSKQFNTYAIEQIGLEFIEPNEHNELITLSANYTSEELAVFTRLIAAIWRHIIDCNFVDTSGYESSYKGIIQFEDDLLKQ